MSRLILILSIFFATENAHALLCKPLKELRKQVASCDQNDYYAEAAIYCLEGFENGAKKSAEALALSLSAGSEAKADTNQAGSREENTLDLGKSKLEIIALLVEALARKKEVEDYGRNINFPEDFDNPAIVKKDPEKFLGNSECYRRSAIVMESVLQELEKHITDLKVLQLRVNSMIGDQETKAGFNSLNKGADNTKRGDSKPKKPKKKRFEKTDSDVTGIPEEELKAEQTKKKLDEAK